MSFKPDLKNPPKQIINEEEIYHQGRDNSNLIIGVVFGGVAVFCLIVMYVVNLLERINLG
jgi:ABC-type multidrug transport system permease subunit